MLVNSRELKFLQEQKFVGATVPGGIARLGSSSVLHTDQLLRLSHDLPLVIEVVDAEDTISKVLPQLDGMMQGGMITIEKACVIFYKKRME